MATAISTLKIIVDVVGDPKQTKGIQNSLADIAKVTAAVAAAGYAAKKAWDFTKEGAQLELTAGQFERVATNAGYAADVLLNEMKAASGGLVSDAELIASGLQIIELGLADTQGGVVDLATVVSRLGLDMQQVIMTFANNSEMRLDALGLSVQSVKERAAELNAEGFDGDAFDKAVLEGLLDRMELLGDTAETTAGQMQKLETNLTNLWDEAKKSASSGAGPFVTKVVEAREAVELLDALVGTGQITMSEYAKTWVSLRTPMADTTTILAELNAKMAVQDAQLRAATLSQNLYTNAAHLGRAAIESAASPLSYYAEYVATTTANVQEQERYTIAAAHAQAILNEEVKIGGASYSELSTSIGSSTTAMQEQIDFIAAGGGAISVMLQKAEEALDAGDLLKAEEFANQASIMATDVQLELDQIDAQEAAEKIQGDLGISFEAAQQMVTDLESSLFNMVARDYFINVGVDYSGTYTPGKDTGIGGVPTPPKVIESYASGTGGWDTVPQTGLYMLHAGEDMNIGPNARNQSGGSGTMINIDTIIVQDGTDFQYTLASMQENASRQAQNAAAGAGYVG